MDDFFLVDFFLVDFFLDDFFLEWPLYLASEALALPGLRFVAIMIYLDYCHVFMNSRRDSKPKTFRYRLVRNGLSYSFSYAAATTHYTSVDARDFDYLEDGGHADNAMD